jgi:outer membrane receptor protein involved in Fe transport
VHNALSWLGYDGNYNTALVAMMGMVTEGFSQYNYKITNTTAATPLAQGAPIQRHWATDTYSIFFQDTWRVRPNVSLTYGLNYQLMTPITETNGQEVTPSVNMGNWFNLRALHASEGIPSNQDAPIEFQPVGSVYGRPGLYSAQTKNFAPRFGLAWTPHPSSGWLKGLLGEDKTVVRLGAGVYFDNLLEPR